MLAYLGQSKGATATPSADETSFPVRRAVFLGREDMGMLRGLSLYRRVEIIIFRIRRLGLDSPALVITRTRSRQCRQAPKR